MSLPPCSKPSECWDWITPEDAVRHALAAFYAACREVSPPQGEPWMVDGEPWSGREVFLAFFSGIFVQRVNAQALDAGVGPPEMQLPGLADGRLWPERATAEGGP